MAIAPAPAVERGSHGAGGRAQSHDNAPPAKVVMQWGAWTKEIQLHGQQVRIGKSDDNDVAVPAPFLARHHAVVEFDGAHYRILDVSGWRGLLSHGKFVPSAVLRTGFTVRIGDGESNLIQLTYYESEEEQHPRPTRIAAGLVSGLVGLLPGGRAEASIGRDSSCFFVLDHPTVSRQHAVLKRARGSWMIQDLQSREGIYLNGRRISHAQLRDGDILQIGPYSARYFGASFAPVDAEAADALRIDVLGGRYDAPPSRRLPGASSAPGPSLLSNINLSVLPGEFVAIVGASGSGKSTLMRLLAGLYPPTEGVVLYNGLDLQVYRSAFTRSVGYVPQDDIVHLELSVQDALLYAARLRLSADLSPKQLMDRVDEVLDAVDLDGRRGQLIKTLSGGQRKRVSIAVELLSQPRLLFLDEPTSGLDPGLDKRMMFLLRRLADRGHTVVLVTHTPAHLDLCDNVVFMGVGGRMGFYGPPYLLTRFFGQADLADVFSSIDGTEAATKWEQRFHDSSLYQDNVVNRQRAIPAIDVAAGTVSLLPQVRLDELFRQCVVVAQRQLAILRNDRWNLALLLLQAPIIAVLVAMVAGSNPFHVPVSGVDASCLAGPGGQRRFCAMQTQSVLFVLACTVIWFGALNSVRELVKERAIAGRERMVGVRPVAYLGAKTGILAALGVLQAVALLAVLGALKGLPASGLAFPPFIEMGVTLVLGGLAGMAMGLAVSALSPTSDRAMVFAPFLLLPQIIFSGVLFPLGHAEPLSFLCPSRWVAAGLGDTLQVYKDQLLQSHTLYSDSPTNLIGQWIALITLIAAWLGLAYWLQERHKGA